MKSNNFKSSNNCQQVISEREYEFGSNFQASLQSVSELKSFVGSDNFSSVVGSDSGNDIVKDKKVKWKNNGHPDIINIESWKEENKIIANKTSQQNNCCVSF